MLASMGVIAVSACATPDAEPGTRQAAECMADALRSIPRVYEVKIVRSYYYGSSGALGYGFRDRSRTQHYAWAELTVRADEHGNYGYDASSLSSSAEDPEREVREEWNMKCHVSGFLIVS